MKKLIIAALLAAALGGCSSPNDIVFGPEPFKQIAEQGDKFKSMPEQERMLLVSYLTVNQMGKLFGGDMPPVTGRTVGEVMKDARAWKEKAAREAEEQKKVEAEQAAKQKKEEAEALALRQKVEEENRQLAAKIAGAVTVAVVDKFVLPKNFQAGRYSELLMVKYAVENKSEKVIRQIKGEVSFTDPSGDAVGSLQVEIDKVLKPGATVQTDTGSGWRTNQFMRGEIEKIAERAFDSMSGSFKVTAVAFDGGEVLKLTEQP